mgnify:CR=1 FL=1
MRTGKRLVEDSVRIELLPKSGLFLTTVAATATLAAVWLEIDNEIARLKGEISRLERLRMRIVGSDEMETASPPHEGATFPG